MKRIFKIFSLIFAFMFVLSSCGAKTETETYVYETGMGKQTIEVSYKNNAVEKISSTLSAKLTDEQKANFETIQKKTEEISKEDGIDAKAVVKDTNGELTVALDFQKVKEDRIADLGVDFGVLSHLYKFKGKDKEFVKTELEKLGYTKK